MKPRIWYHFTELSKEQREFYEIVLLEELDLQTWFAVAYSSIVGEEVLLPTQ